MPPPHPETWLRVTPEGLHCARCDSCRLRAKGFVEAGVPDPTHYADA